jgi:hypothetical protein
MTKQKYALGIILLISAFFNLSGINWGLPGLKRISLILPLELRNNDFYSVMKNTRDDIYKFSNGSSLGRSQNTAQPNVTPIMMSMGMDKKENFELPKDMRSLANFIRPYILMSNHFDEQMTIASLARMNLKKLDFNPRLYQYGGTYIYSVGAWLFALKAAGVITLNSDLTFYFTHPERLANLLVAARLVNVIFIILTVIAVFLTANLKQEDVENPELENDNLNTGVVSCLLFAIAPAVVFEAHIIKPYCVSAFFAVCCLYYAIKITKEPNKSINYILSGVFCGFTIGSMPFYGLIITAPLTAIILEKRNLIKRFMILSIALFAAFVVTNPYWILDYKGLLFELTAFSKGKASGQMDLFFMYFFKQMPVGLTISFLIAYLGGVLLAIKTRQKSDIVLLTSSIIPVVVSAWMFKNPILTIVNSRFLLPWIAVMSIVAARFICSLAGSEKSNKILYAGILLFTLCLFQQGLYSTVIIRNYISDSSLNSTRLLAGEWIMKNIPEGSKIGISDLPNPSNLPPFDLNKYKLSVFFTKDGIDSEEYFVSVNLKPEFLESSGFKIVKEFKPSRSLLGIKYDFGITPVNSEVYIYKKITNND